MEIPKIDKSHYKSIVYISHPFQNNPENVKEIEDIIKGLRRLFPDYLFISPVHAFGFLYNSTTYEQGLYMTLFLLETCADEMWVFGEDWRNSTGVKAEIEYCKKRNIPYYIWGTSKSLSPVESQFVSHMEKNLKGRFEF